MAWGWINQDVDLQWDGAHYYVKDLGSDGNCLFRSLAFVAALAGGGLQSHVDLRQAAIDELIQWVLALPVWFDDQRFETPTEARISNLVSGDWGDLTCMLAVLHGLFPTFRINVLNAWPAGALDQETYAIDLTVAGQVVTADVHIMFLGGNHYVALIPAAADVENVKVISASLVALEPKPDPSSLSVKLSTVSGLSKKLNTLSQKEASLEIHQINVGIGDCTLILVKGADGEYKLSLMIDSGRFAEPVTGYLDNLISLKRFRRIDYFLATHYDADHIGAAPAVLGNAKYAADGLRLYDPGEPVFFASDYTDYRKAFGDANSGRRNLPDLEQPLASIEGVQIRVVAMNGFYASQKKGHYATVKEAFMDEDVPKRLVSGNATLRDWQFEGWSPGTLYPEDPNDTSLAVLVTFGNFVFYTAGDLNGRAEDIIAVEIFRSLAQSHVCACKLNHHGAHESSSPRVLRLLRPRLCLISCGTPNVFGHPSSITLSRLAQLNKVYPCDAIITADLDVEPTKKGTPWGKPASGDPGEHNQGSIVITTTHSMASRDDHAFLTMTSRNPEPRLIRCGQRPFNAKLAIVDARSSIPMSEERKSKKRERKEQRKRDDFHALALARQELRLTLKAKLGRVISEAMVGFPDAERLLQDGLDGVLDALTEALYKEDEEQQAQKVNTVAKNFAKAFPAFSSPEQMAAWLRKQR